jgi:hypothetical protein
LFRFQLGFADVLAEPKTAQGFDFVWRLAFVVFTQSKLWLYRLFAAFVAIPAALFWALIFSIVTVLYVWILAPALRLFEFKVYIFTRVSQKSLHHYYGTLLTATLTISINKQESGMQENPLTLIQSMSLVLVHTYSDNVMCNSLKTL